jgi:hypothetical protein
MSCGMDEIYERVSENFYEEHGREPTDEEWEDAFQNYCEGVASCYDYGE